jgi:hypothetical protein
LEGQKYFSLLQANKVRSLLGGGPRQLSKSF